MDESATSTHAKKDGELTQLSPEVLSALYFLAILVCAIFLAEARSWLDLPLLHDLSEDLEIISHSLITTLLVFPFLYFLAYRPLLKQSLQRARVEAELHNAYEKVELRVQERTQELSDANEKLESQIAERRKAEDSLRVLTTALQTAANGVVITNRSGIVEWCNPAFTLMTGYSKDEVLGRNLSLLKSGEHPPYFYQGLWDTILQGRVWDGEIINRRRDNSCYVEEQTITPVKDLDGEITHFIAIKNDITEKRKAAKLLEEERKRAEEQMEHSLRQLEFVTQSESKQRQVAEGLVQAALSMNRSLDPDLVLDCILDQLEFVIPGSITAVFLLEGDKLYLSRYRGLAVTEASLVSLQHGVPTVDLPFTSLLLTERHSFWNANTALPDEWVSLPHMEMIQSLILVPLIAGDHSIGLIALASAQPDYFDVGNMAQVQAFAAQAVLAIRNAQLFHSEQQARRTAEILRDASITFTKTLDLKIVLEQLLKYISRLVPYDTGSVYLFSDNQTLELCESQNGKEHNQAPINHVVIDPEGNPGLSEVLHAGHSLLMHDPSTYSKVRDLMSSETVTSVIFIPLHSEDQVIGVCILEKCCAGRFTQQHLQWAEALLSQAAAAVQNAWLFRQVQTARERLQLLSRRMVEVQEKERRWIARELHDEAGQTLTTLKLGLRLLDRNADDPDAVRRAVIELNKVADGVLENLHQLAVDLRPASLDHLGLVGAVRQLTEHLADQHGVDIRFESLGIDHRLPAEIEITLYRIMQEALSNILRHASASRVDILLERRDGKVIALVEDNGIGFDPERVAPKSRLGMLGMSERVEMVNGRLSVESQPGKGTAIFVEVPLGD